MPATRLRIFVSSVQKEFAQLRRDLKEKGIIEQRGNRGLGIHYVLAKKGDIEMAHKRLKRLIRNWT